MTQINDGWPDGDQTEVTVVRDRPTNTSALPVAIETSDIGPYEITGLLGRGGMGIVYRAVHRETRQAVALKTALVRDASHLACMRREIHALGRLGHPGVVRIIEEGVEGGVPWYAMELLDPERSLRTLLDSGTPLIRLPDEGDDEVTVGRKPRIRDDLPRILTVMYQLCRVLGYIHGHGIVHRDLKPANVLLGDGDRPILVDFGLMVRFRGDSSREVLEVGGQSLGTFTYISPEQADGQLVDARTDLYSFGVILYEAITGRPPFDATSFARLTHQLFFEPPIAPSQWVDGLPPVLDDLVLRLMEKKPGDRYGYADDVAAMLVEAGAEPEPDANDEGPAYLYRPELEGRGAIMETLAKRLDTVLLGNGTFVAVGGVSGIGKTSVATAFSRKATRKKMLVITGECVPVTTDGEIGGEPLHPLRPLLHAIADHCLQFGPAELDRVIGARLATLEEYLPGLAEAAKAPGDEGLLTSASGRHVSARHRRLFPDLAEVLAAFTRDQPVLLILDDLQWADEVTLRFLASLRQEFFTGTKLMILGFYRSDEVGPELSDLLAAPHLAKISLERLDDGSVAAIVKSMLAESDPSQTFVQFVARQSEGSPFFVAEYLRAAVSERLLHREGGRWRLRQGDGDAAWAKLGLPGSVLDLVGHRLAALSPATRHIAEVAAVLGRELDELLLLAAAGVAEVEAMEAVSDLVARQILEQQAGRLRFVHDKQREVLYGKLTAERRRELHRRAAVAIESHSRTPGAPQPNLAELANHWEVAGAIDKAIDSYEMAGQQALRSGAGREASDYMQHVLALAGNASTTVQQRARRARWHGLLSDARWSLSDFTGFHEHAREVLALAGMPLPRTPLAHKWTILRQVAEQAAHLLLPRALYRSRRSKWPLLSQASNTAERIAEHAFYAKDSLMMAC
ncbi:MAG TPA: protein kinase, partial [Dehalococcoidia bacterium]